MWITCFSASQNAKNESHLKHKTKCVTEFLLTVRSSSIKDYTCHYVVSTQKTNVYINFNKNNENLEIFFTSNRVFKHKEVVSKLHVWSNGLGKMWPSNTFHFSTRILTYTLKGLNIFSHNICRDVQQSIFSSR